MSNEMMEENDIMRYPFQSAADKFLTSRVGVYSDGMWSESERRYRKIAGQIEKLWKDGKISTKDPAKFNVEDIKAYVIFQRGRSLKDTSISHDVCAINMVCKFIGDNRCVETTRVQYPLLFVRRRKKLLPIIERADVDRIISSADRLDEESDFQRVRAYAETLFAISAGSRTEELQHAKIRYLSDDITTFHFDYVKGKNTYGESRTVPVRPDCRKVMALYLRLREKKFGDRSDYLFPSPSKGFLATNTLTKDRAIVISEVGYTYDYRACRRTYAQFLLDEGFPSDKVSILMGHATSKTTETNYARPREDRVVKEVLKKWSSENNDTEI